MTREEWLRHAVEEIDAVVFEGDLNLLNHDFQIACGRVQSTKLSESIQPYDGENVSIEDFFPTTININFTIKDTREMLVALTFECIHAFFEIKNTNKRFKELANKYYFEKPYKEPHPSDHLKELIIDVLDRMEKKYGKFPGKPVYFHKPEKKEGKKNTIEAMCPECGYNLKIARKVFEAHNNGLPTCVCGTKMIRVSDEES